MNKGKFITFEGCEGVGKSTQVKLLESYLKQRGVPAYFTREPGGTQSGELMRSIIMDKKNNISALTELLLYSAARAQHVGEVILPKLYNGIHVVCDRFYDSTYAYQGFGRGLDRNMINSLNKTASLSLVPSLTLFLDLPPELGFKRKGGRDENDRLECDTLDFHKRVYEGFLSISEPRFVHIDASGSKEQTHSKIIEQIERLLL